MSLKNQATSGLVWTFAEQFGNQIIGFVVSLVLARILLPSQFGLIGMISVLIGLGRVLVDSGMTQSLIRNPDLTSEDFSTVFYFNLAASILIYVIIFFAAPLVAQFYEQPILISVIRLYCLTFIFSAFSAVQLAKLTKSMNFKVQTLVSIPASIIGGIVGIIMAYNDFGVFSLVWSQIVMSVIRNSQIWIYSKWTPGFSFSISKFKEHFNFGYKMALSGVLEVLFKNAYLLVIGKYYSAKQVGFYTRADTMNQLPVNNISNALKKVTYPLFAEIQGDNIRLKRVYKQLMQMVIYVLAPLLILVAVLAEPIFRFLFTAKWLPAVPYFQILCFTGILKPIHSYNLNVLKVKGRSDLFLKLKLYEKLLIVVGIIIGLQFGIYGLLYSQVIASGLIFFINAHKANEFINYSAWEQIKDISPPFFLAILCGGVVFLIDIKIEDQLDIFRILIGGTVGAVIYLLSSVLLKMQSYQHLRNIIARKW